MRKRLYEIIEAANAADQLTFANLDLASVVYDVIIIPHYPCIQSTASPSCYMHVSLPKYKPEVPKTPFLGALEWLIELRIPI